MKIAKRCVCCDGGQLTGRPAILMPFVAHRVFGWEPVRVEADWGMRDIPQGVAQSVCKSLMCDACGLLFLDMRFDDEEMAALYDDYRGPAYSAARERFEPGYTARNALLLDGSDYRATIESLLADAVPARPRVLDWGGDSGVNTPFRGRAAAHDIYDISGRPVVDGARRVDRAAALSQSYDLVVCGNVIEHVSWPRDILRDIAAFMGPRTALYLEVPHEDVVRLIDEPGARLAAKRHWHEHINFFTAEALDAALASAGLVAAARVSHPVVAGGKASHVFSIVARKDG